VRLRLRDARLTDAVALGRILWHTQREADWMPHLYGRVDCIRYCAVMIARGWVRVASVNGAVRGFLARDGEEICALYLDARAKGLGIGKQMLDEAKQEARALWLRCSQDNGGAQRFYLREGFVEHARGDGRDRAEQLPDITYIWAGEACA